MVLTILFVFYLLLLILQTIILSFNSIKIAAITQMNPKILTSLYPLLLNFVLANTVFRSISALYTTLIPCLICFFLDKRLQNIRIFGLTGSIATGKQALLKQIQNNLKSLQIIDCQKIFRSLSKKGQSGYNSIIKECGKRSQQFLDLQTQEIQRQRFQQMVLQDDQLRGCLCKRIGLILFFPVLKQIFINLFKGKRLMLLYAPILYETKILEYLCYPIIVVGCSKKNQIKRLLLRKKSTEQFVIEKLNKIQSRMPLQEKLKRCQIQLHNDSSQQMLLSQFLTKVKIYMQKKYSISALSKAHKKIN